MLLYNQYFFNAPKKDFLYSNLFFWSSARISISLFICFAYQSIIHLICLYIYLCNVISHFIEVVKWLSSGLLFETPWTAAYQAPLSSAISQSLLKFMSIKSMIYITSSSFASLFSFYLQCFPASGSFPLSQFFVSPAQSIGASIQL